MKQTFARTIWTALLIVGFAAGQIAHAQKPSLPDTPAGKRLGEFFDAIASTDPAKWKKFAAEGHAKSFLEKHPVNDLVDMLKTMNEREGAFELIKVEKSEPYAISVQARNKEEGRTFWIDLKVEPQAPYGIIGVGFDTQPPDKRPKGPGKVIEKN